LYPSKNPILAFTTGAEHEAAQYEHVEFNIGL